jgi:hypothetical protein
MIIIKIIFKMWINVWFVLFASFCFLAEIFHNVHTVFPVKIYCLKDCMQRV